MKFWEESGRVNGRGSVGSTHSVVHLENPESSLRWYFKYFLGTAHQNYYGKTVDANGEKDIFVLSLLKSEENYRAIIWTKTGIHRRLLPSTKPLSAQTICQESGDWTLSRAPREIKSTDIQEDLLVIEEQDGAINFKFGVLYRKAGQTTENEILCNDSITPAFDKFLNLIGEPVRLKGFKEYRGGLDVRDDTTGTHSYRTIIEGKSIMFHVANLLPYSRENPQQVERKRHIGNDIVVIVFQEEDQEFDPTCFKSHMSHIYALVTYRASTESYLLTVYNADTVPPYGPELAGEYTDRDHFKRLLLVKLINGEKAVYETPDFIKRKQRTIDQLLREIHTRYGNDQIGEITGRIIETTPRIGRKKKKQKAAQLQEKGQNLKVQRIMTGKAPTSRHCISMSLQRRVTALVNWTCEQLAADLNYRINCADFWESYILLGTDEGMSLFNTDTGQLLEIYDTFVPRQIYVVEDLSVAVVRAEYCKNKSQYVLSFDLSTLTMKSGSTRNFKRKTKNERVQGTKGALLLSPYLTISSKFYLAVYKPKLIQLYEWIKIPGQGQGWFRAQNEFPVSDHVRCMSMFSRRSGLKICVGTASEFLMIDADGRGGATSDRKKYIEKLRPHKAANASNLFITPVMSCESSDQNDWVIGVLLTYSHNSVIEQFSLRPKEQMFFHIKWNIKPQFVHSCLPYFIAVGSLGVEVRLASNGSMVHNIDLNNISYLSHRGPKIYLSRFLNGVSDLSVLTTFLSVGSCSTISGSEMALSNGSDEFSPDSPGSTLKRSESRSPPSLRRSFNDPTSRGRAFTQHTAQNLAENPFSCLSLNDLRQPAAVVTAAYKKPARV